ncbi:asparaginase [filamentous cyanobacterium LEGE 11480]|uniref:Asparaginase n=1 Tax=Romeriopsis navalis LEGE 11480 TaxID=2777977 RepID=A0A928VPP2_9CYAN|nr:asparaginase [Romeriopsis navalis]MBE9031523.1 asparaginase [Romeriopsis navalis LEGE 11480]
MTLRKSQAPELKIQLLREGIVESIHYAHAVVSDDQGRILFAAGNPNYNTFIRSALKPFQAMCVTTTGTLEKFNLTDRDLAIMCASHRGTPAQARQAFNILWRADIEPTALQCPIPANARSNLQHNCSGKHAGMLAACRQLSLPTATYLSRKHPLQQLILGKVAELLRVPAVEFIGARDDCGAPTYLMQLSHMAYLYAHLAAGQRVELERTMRAMTHHAPLIADVGQFDTELMRLTAGELVSKTGAEGVQCVGRVGESMGLAIKVADGTKRAKFAATIHALKQMGWISSDIADTLAEQFIQLSEFTRLDVHGEMVMCRS